MTILWTETGYDAQDDEAMREQREALEDAQLAGRVFVYIVVGMLAAMLILGACASPTAPRGHGDCLPIVEQTGDTVWVLPGTAHGSASCTG
jgi:hypothetical protein